MDYYVDEIWRSGRDKCIPLLELVLDVDVGMVLDPDAEFIASGSGFGNCCYYCI